MLHNIPCVPCQVSIPTELFQAQSEQKSSGGGYSFPGGMPGAGGPESDMPDLGNLFKDPDILAAMQVIP